MNTGLSRRTVAKNFEEKAVKKKIEKKGINLK